MSIENLETQEAEFLNQYCPTDYDLLSVSVDNVVFSVDCNENTENYRKLDEQKLMVLLVKRSEHPAKGKWALPGGFMGINETAREAAFRSLNLKTGLKNIYLEQLYTFDNPQRDPRMRIVSCAYMALIDRSNQFIQNEHAAWFQVQLSSDGRQMVLKCNEIDISMEVKYNKVENGRLRSLESKVVNSELAFDHADILLTALQRLRNKVEYTDIVFNLLPEKFTIAQLQSLYEIILDQKLLAAAFRRKIASKIEETGEYSQEKGHRPSQYFRYKQNMEVIS